MVNFVTRTTKAMQLFNKVSDQCSFDQMNASPLRSRMMQFLGRISMSLYLVNMPVIEWISFFLNIRQISTKLPTWTIPVQITLSLLSATALTVFVEEPCKNRLRTMLKKPQNSKRLHLFVLIFVTLGCMVALVGGYLKWPEVRRSILPASYDEP